RKPVHVADGRHTAASGGVPRARGRLVMGISSSGIAPTRSDQDQSYVAKPIACRAVAAESKR
ncbi:MAG: hypothetical protein WBP81_07320, partial [Solirubrobacteraceae bacterium]